MSTPPRDIADFLELANNCAFLDRKLISALKESVDGHKRGTSNVGPPIPGLNLLIFQPAQSAGTIKMQKPMQPPNGARVIEA
jgi:hypothetical protein